MADLPVLAARNFRHIPHQSVAHVRSSIVLDRLKESSKLPLKSAR